MSKIKVSLGKTYNLGNYESLRIDIGVEEEVDGLVTEAVRKEVVKKVTEFVVKTAKELGVKD